MLFGFIKGKSVHAQMNLRVHGIFYGGRSNTTLWGDVDDVLYEILQSYTDSAPAPHNRIPYYTIITGSYASAYATTPRCIIQLLYVHGNGFTHCQFSFLNHSSRCKDRYRNRFRVQAIIDTRIVLLGGKNTQKFNCFILNIKSNSI